MQQYLWLMNDILNTGIVSGDRTGTGTISTFGQKMSFDLSKGFPATTTKRLAWKSVVSELLWFLEGSSDERRLAEILYDKPREELTDKTTIWTDNANASYWQDKARFEGDLGDVYGVQWRAWPRTKTKTIQGAFGEENVEYSDPVDQITNIINTIKNNPNDRRIMLNAWNVASVDNGSMALPPCHCLAQFYVRDGKLSCQMYQRSVDTFLGLPFNIASYALLTHILAQITGLKVGTFHWVGGDTHIYSNHIDAVEEQLKRQPYDLPELLMPANVSECKTIDEYLSQVTINSFQLLNYNHHSTIKASMAV